MRLHLERLKQQAFSLAIREVPTEEIAEIMGISVQRVQKYIRDSSRDMAKTVQAISQEDYVGIAASRYNAMREEAWAQYQAASSAKDKGVFLRLLLKIDEQEADFFEKRGLLQKTPDRQEISITVAQKQLMADPDKVSRLDAMAVMMMSQQLGVDPADIQQMLPDRNIYSLTRTDLLTMTPPDYTYSTPTRTPIPLSEHIEPSEEDDPDEE